MNKKAQLFGVSIPGDVMGKSKVKFSNDINFRFNDKLIAKQSILSELYFDLGFSQLREKY